MKSPFTPAIGLLLLGAAAAHAQSNVTVYGLLDVAVHQKQLSGEEKNRGVSSGLMTTSRWGISGSEDLGNGLRANFDLGSFIQVNNGAAGRSPTDAFWGRFAWVGLSGDFGQTRFGRITAPGFTTAVRFNPFGDAAGLSPFLIQTYLPSPTQPLMTSNGSADSSWLNAASYTTPTFGGLNATLIASAGQRTANGRRLGGGLLYGTPDSALAAGLSFERISKASFSFPRRNPAVSGALPPFTLGESTSTILGASYDFKVVKVFGQYAYAKLESLGVEDDVKLKTTQLGLSVPAGGGSVLASVSRTRKTETALDALSRTTSSLGYDYFLSKRTDLYAVAMVDKASDLARGTSLAVGMRHRF